MNILVPVNNLESIPYLCKQGAKELYVGFHDNEWTRDFGEYANLNRMSSFGFDANPYTLNQLEAIIETAHHSGADLFVTLNAESYTSAMEQRVQQYLSTLAKMGVDGIIVSGINIARIVVKLGLRAVASTMCGIYNRDIAKAYVQEGVSRIILPRDLSLPEIESIVKATPGIEYEVFMLNSGCKFSDSFCLGFHFDQYGALCKHLCRSQVSFVGKHFSFNEKQSAILNEVSYQSLYSSSTTCGLCALFRLNKMGISACKIVGRAEQPNKILHDISLVKKNLDIVSECKSEEEFLSRMVFPDNHDRVCFLGRSCYYPEIRFGDVKHGNS